MKNLNILSGKITPFLTRNFFTTARRLIEESEFLDFKTNDSVARKWGGSKFKDWRKSLNPFEKLSIHNYTLYDDKFINKLLKKHNGILEQRPDYISEVEWEEEQYDKINKKIKLIDSALSKIKLNQATALYRRVDLSHFYEYEQFDKKDNEIRKPDGKIDLDIVEKFKSDLINDKINLNPTFISSSLSLDPPGAIVFRSRQIVMKMFVPRGINAAFLGDLSVIPIENEVLIARNQQMKFTKVWVTILHGQEVMMVQTELVK